MKTCLTQTEMMKSIHALVNGFPPFVSRVASFVRRKVRRGEAKSRRVNIYDSLPLHPAKVSPTRRRRYGAYPGHHMLLISKSDDTFIRFY